MNTRALNKCTSKGLFHDLLARANCGQYKCNDETADAGLAIACCAVCPRFYSCTKQNMFVLSTGSCCEVQLFLNVSLNVKKKGQGTSYIFY